MTIGGKKVGLGTLIGFLASAVLAGSGQIIDWTAQWAPGGKMYVGAALQAIGVLSFVWTNAVHVADTAPTPTTPPPAA